MPTTLLSTCSPTTSTDFQTFLRPWTILSSIAVKNHHDNRIAISALHILPVDAKPKFEPNLENQKRITYMYWWLSSSLFFI